MAHRRAAAVAAVAACLLLAACSAGSAPRPTLAVSTSTTDPYGLASVPWPQDDAAASAWLGRLPDEVAGLTKVPADQSGDGFDFVVYRGGPAENDRSVSWFAGGGADGLLGVLDVEDGAVPCEQWASSPSLEQLAGLAGPVLAQAAAELPDPLPEAVPWFACTFTTDEAGEALAEADWEQFASWVSGDRSFSVSTHDEAERDLLVRAAVDAAAS